MSGSRTSQRAAITKANGRCQKALVTLQWRSSVSREARQVTGRRTHDEGAALRQADQVMNAESASRRPPHPAHPYQERPHTGAAAEAAANCGRSVTGARRTERIRSRRVSGRGGQSLRHGGFFDRTGGHQAIDLASLRSSQRATDHSGMLSEQRRRLDTRRRPYHLPENRRPPRPPVRARAGRRAERSPVPSDADRSSATPGVSTAPLPARAGAAVVPSPRPACACGSMPQAPRR